MEKVIGELDANFLLAAALGYSCVVYDYGSRDKKRGAPRALWYGLEFVRYALNVEWFGAADRVPVLRGKNVSRDFSKKIRSFSKSAKKKLRYYRKFLTDDVKKHGCVRLVGVYTFTTHDDDETFYATLLRSACAPRATEASNKERDDDENVFDGELKKKRKKQDSSRRARACARWRRSGSRRSTAGTRTRSGWRRCGGRMCRCAGVSRSRLRAFYANARAILI